MSRVMALVSPHMKGDDVRALQAALKSNIFHTDYLASGKVDGEFGILTAQAVHRAQYWLGYRTPTQVSGSILPAYLSGAKRLSTAMHALRWVRIRKYKAAHAPLREKAFAEALKYVGMSESPPGSNQQMFGRWYGMDGVAWCAIFQSYCYAAAGSTSVKRGSRWAYCPYVVADAHAGRNGLSVTTKPQRGDLVLYDWGGDGVADHIEMFDEWVVPGQTFRSIGGNTSPTDASNGGMVVHYGTGPFGPRSKSNVLIFAHLSS